MNGETKKKSVGSVLYDDVMGGLRPMIPFVAGGGILMAISFMFGMRIGDDSVNQFAKILYEIGHNNAMLLMIPIFAGFIAHTIAGQDALAPGMIGGMIAKTTGSGFLGGIVAGFLAGYLVKLLNKLLSNFPEDFQSIKNF
ncbi:MAG: PTS transporter subunit EIIC [Anaerostipes sp.]